MMFCVFAGAETAAVVRLFPPPLDKLAHFSYYGLMTLLLLYATGPRWLWLSVAIVLLVGLADEWNQSMIAGRDASVGDWLANALGAALCAYGYTHWAAKKELCSESENDATAPR
jgi:VanZ family protein